MEWEGNKMIIIGVRERKKLGLYPTHLMNGEIRRCFVDAFTRLFFPSDSKLNRGRKMLDQSTWLKGLVSETSNGIPKYDATPRNPISIFEFGR